MSWCEHSAQSWTKRRNGEMWCNDCKNYVDGWRRSIRTPWPWLMGFFVLAQVMRLVSAIAKLWMVKP